MSMKKFVVKNNLGIILENKSFKDLTTIKVGGKIKTLFYPNTIDSLKRVVCYLLCKKKQFFIIGNGSNIVASDRIFYPVVINGKHIENQVNFYDDYFTCSAFMDMRFLNAKLIEKNISTLLDLSGIPATIGGAIVMNAGALKSRISDNLIWVNVLEDGVSKKYYKDELTFGYRSSSFKKNTVILEASFKIIYSAESVILYQEILRKRREKHPLNYPNCGSVFKNLSNIKAYEVIRKIEMNSYVIGDAMFSEKHSNFIVNLGHAKAMDIYQLISLAKKKAFEMYDINLEEEVLLLNFKEKSFFKIINF